MKNLPSFSRPIVSCSPELSSHGRTFLAARKRQYSIYRVAIVFVALAGGGNAWPAGASQFRWVGGAANDNWTSSANWALVSGSGIRPSLLNDDILYNNQSTPRLTTQLANTNVQGSGGPWQLAKITVSSITGDATINRSGNIEIELSGSIGGVGIDMSAALANLNVAPIVRLTGNQSWNVASGRTLTKSSGDLLLQGNTLTIAGGGDAVISSLITSTGGGLTVNTPGTVTLSANNTYTGNTTVGGNGTLIINGDHSGGNNLTANVGFSGGHVVLGSGASFTGNGNLNAPFFGTVELGTGASMNMAGSGNAAAGSSIKLLDGATLDLGTTLTLNLAGNAFGGQLNVGSGAVVTAGQEITVGPVGSVVGVGTVASTGGDVIFQPGSFLIPGQSAGTLTFDTPAGSLDISGAAASTSPSFVYELGGISDSDMVVLTSGLLDIGTDLLEFDDFAFIPLAGFGPGEYVLFDTGAPVNGTLGANLSGQIDGIDAVLSLRNSQDIVLSVGAAVPEPGALAIWLLVAVISTALAWRTRRRP